MNLIYVLRLGNVRNSGKEYSVLAVQVEVPETKR